MYLLVMWLSVTCMFVRLATFPKFHVMHACGGHVYLFVDISMVVHPCAGHSSTFRRCYRADTSRPAVVPLQGAYCLSGGCFTSTAGPSAYGGDMTLPPALRIICQLVDCLPERAIASAQNFIASLTCLRVRAPASSSVNSHWACTTSAFWLASKLTDQLEGWKIGRLLVDV